MKMLIVILIFVCIMSTFKGYFLSLLLCVQKTLGPILLWRPANLWSFLSFYGTSIQNPGYTVNWDTTTAIRAPYDLFLADYILPFGIVRRELLAGLSKKNIISSNNNIIIIVWVSVCVFVLKNTRLYISRKTLQLVVCSLLNLVILERQFYKPDFVRFLYHFGFVWTLLYGFSTFGRLKRVLPFVAVEPVE
jgi:hypothetical protein